MYVSDSVYYREYLLLLGSAVEMHMSLSISVGVYCWQVTFWLFAHVAVFKEQMILFVHDVMALFFKLFFGSSPFLQLKEKERLSQNMVQFEDLLTINDYLA